MRVNVNNQDKVQSILDEVNGRASAHVLTSYCVVQAAITAENRLNTSYVPLGMRKGVKLQYKPEGPGKAYSRKGRFIMTNRITLERGAADWFLTHCERFEAFSNSREFFVLGISKDVEDVIANKALVGYSTESV